MERAYDLFEMIPDGGVIWRGHAQGLQNTRRKLEDLAKQTANEIIAVHLPDNITVARVNGTGSLRKSTKRIFQIAYDEALLVTRAGVLRMLGYEVDSVIGDDAAKVVLGMGREYDLFMVGHNAPLQTRMEMVAWLKARHPNAKILALNPPGCEHLEGADYDARQNGPDTWMPKVTAALAA
jgi:hypothetical protein